LFLLEPEDDITFFLDKIKYDSDCSFPELEHMWKQTTKHRLCEIQKASSTAEILQKWKSYTQPFGYILVRRPYNLEKKHFAARGLNCLHIAWPPCSIIYCTKKHVVKIYNLFTGTLSIFLTKNMYFNRLILILIHFTLTVLILNVHWM